VSCAFSSIDLMEHYTIFYILCSLSDCEVVVEAVFEDMRVKQDVFRRLDGVCKPTCLIASNTSSLDIEKMTSVMRESRAPFILGLHFFVPAYVVKLVEVVVCSRTSLTTAQVAMQLTKKLGKVGVLVRQCPFLSAHFTLPQFSDPRQQPL
jgi:3-hydroxyacyl-CoA dehydrogenase